jgi:hypothetical protein
LASIEEIAHAVYNFILLVSLVSLVLLVLVFIFRYFLTQIL